MFLFRDKAEMVEPRGAAAGRDEPMVVPEQHYVLGRSITPPFPDGFERVVFGLLLGRRARLLAAPGRVHDRGRLLGRLHTERDVQRSLRRQDWACRGRTRRLRPGEDELRGDASALLGKTRSDPGDAPGNDFGTQYRSGIYWEDEAHLEAAELSREVNQRELRDAGYGEITTEIAQASPFYYASRTTSSTSRRTRTATAAWAEPGQLPGRARNRKVVTALQWLLRRGVEQSGSSPGS
jgi:peptide-methionine (S)-S-oxide reductase